MHVDGLGRELHVSDRVAYISRYGSRIHVEEREISVLGYDELYGDVRAYIRFTDSNRKVNPLNTVRLS